LSFACLSAEDPEASFAARLELTNGQTEGWMLLGPDGEELRRGSGLRADHLREGLAPGVYTIIWDTVNNEGSHAWISSDFTVG
jgi:hypothetical protein